MPRGSQQNKVVSEHMNGPIISTFRGVCEQYNLCYGCGGLNGEHNLSFLSIKLGKAISLGIMFFFKCVFSNTLEERLCSPHPHLEILQSGTRETQVPFI